MNSDKTKIHAYYFSQYVQKVLQFPKALTLVFYSRTFISG